MTAHIAISGKSSTGPEQLKREGVEDTGLQATLKKTTHVVYREHEQRMGNTRNPQ